MGFPIASMEAKVQLFKQLKLDPDRFERVSVSKANDTTWYIWIDDTTHERELQLAARAAGFLYQRTNSFVQLTDAYTE